MKNVLLRKLKQTYKRIARYRKQGYPECVRKEKRNVQAIKRQLDIVEGKAS